MENEDRTGEARPAESEASVSEQPALRSRHSGLMGRQDFSQIHTADNSRNHFGNVVHNHIYPDNTAHHEHAKVTLELMDALAFKGMTDRVMAISPACAETCTWFLHNREYISWRDPARRHAHNGVLWIKGKAGTGKSTLMRYIHDHAQEHHQDEVDIAFFFNGRSPYQVVKSVEGMYRSILYQLYKRVPRLKAVAARRVATTNKRVWSIEILEDMIRQSVLHLAPDEKIAVYVDALDECESDQVRSAVEFFESLSRSATAENKQFSICFSSRYYPHITVQSHEEVKLDTLAEHSADIKTFLASEFTIRSPFRSELQAEIEERCSGIFLWVILVVHQLMESFDRGATRSQLHDTLNSLPRELDALFAKISESADAGYAVAMRWVSFAERLLSPTELYLIVHAGSSQLDSNRWYIEDEDMDIESIHRYILHISRGLIECQTTHGGHQAVQFIHESVREYVLLQGQPSVKPVVQQIREVENHARIAEDCQCYLRRHTRGPVYMQIENQLPNYILLYAFKHIEVAHANKAIDFEPSDFPIREYIALHNAKTTEYEEDYFVPGHSAALLSLLIEHGCYVLVEAVLRKSTRPGFSTTNHIEQRSPPSANRANLITLDLSTLCGGRWGSPLHTAVHAEKQDLVRLLLERGADIDCRGEVILHRVSQRYNSPLLLAMEHGQAAMVQLLLDHGACIKSLSTENGFNALHGACQHYDIAMVRQLLDRGADVTLPCRLDPYWDSFRGSTALHIAIASNKSHPNFPELLSMLLAAGSNVNTPDRNGMTPLHVAASETSAGVPCADVLRSLLVVGAKVDATDARGRTALAMAVFRGRSAEVQILLDYKANMDHRGKTGKSQTAIEIAHSHRHQCIVEILQSEVRLRALKGLSPEAALPTSISPNTPKKRPPSRIPAPVQSRSRRTKRPLQYRRLSPYHPGDNTWEEMYWSSELAFPCFDVDLCRKPRGRAKDHLERLRPPAPSPPPFRYSPFAYEAKVFS